MPTSPIGYNATPKNIIKIIGMNIIIMHLGNAIGQDDAMKNRNVQKSDKKLSNSRKMNYILSIIIIGLGLVIVHGAHLFAANFGNTLAGIDTPFSSANLAVINNAPNSYFQSAGEMFLNNTLKDPVILSQANSSSYSPPEFNGKPSVIYIGAISCVFCGENRWAMALALSRFGKFGSLYVGYSAIHDSDVPTIYWLPVNYTTQAGVSYGNTYNSTYISFLSADYESPITQGFTVQPISYFIQNAPNSTYREALNFMNSTNKFGGTPFTIWGNTLVPGADAIVFGNTTPTTSVFPITNMTHAEVLSQLKNFNDQFAWAEYAAADVYVSYICAAINNSAPVCALPAIRSMEAIS